MTDQNNPVYTGPVTLYVESLLTPVIVDDLTIIIGLSTDNSNATYLGLINIDYAPTGIISIEATQEQADAIAESSIIYVELQAETSPQMQDNQNATSTGSSIENTEYSAEIQVLNTSQLGSLFIP